MAGRVLEEFESELYLLRWEKRGGEWILELLLDKEEPVTTADCARVSDRVSGELDRLNLIQKEFVLQVSSPGIERPLVEARHFKDAVGSRVELHTYAPIADAKSFVGTLKSYDEERDRIAVEVDGEDVEVSLEGVSKATTKDIQPEV